MKIIEKKKVSFAIRLKELMEEQKPPFTQEKLAELLRNPAFEDNPVNPHTISKWMNGGTLRRRRKEILQQLADIFDVDPEYLECTQAEKRKVSFSFPSIDDKLANDVRKLEVFTEYLKSIGIKYNFITSSGHTEVFKYIDSGYLYTVEDTVGDAMEVQFSIGEKTSILSESQFDEKKQELEKYTKYLLFN